MISFAFDIYGDRCLHHKTVFLSQLTPSNLNETGLVRFTLAGAKLGKLFDECLREVAFANFGTNSLQCVFINRIHKVYFAYRIDIITGVVRVEICQTTLLLGSGCHTAGCRQRVRGKRTVFVCLGTGYLEKIRIIPGKAVMRKEQV